MQLPKLLLLGLCLALAVPAFALSGDADADGTVTLADVFALVKHLRGGAKPAGDADVNRDARLDQKDVAYLVEYLFGDGPPPMEPWRFLEQTTFGPTDALAARVRAIGFEEFLNQQFAMTPTGYPTFPPEPSAPGPDCDAICVRDHYSPYPLQRIFFTNALTGEDQLRQRVAWALHKILVVAAHNITQPKAMAPYLQVIDRNAFGNYRQLLQEMTLNPGMGAYLNMVSSTRNNPNENYAREILQLFSIGTVLLDPDGTPKLGADGEPLPTYDQPIVEGFTKAFTGWRFDAPKPGEDRNDSEPMIPRGSDSHDTGEKLLLGNVVLPPRQSERKDLEDALDNIFRHPNVGPFIGKQLIQSLVTSNPSPAYVARVSAAFDDDGRGVRGDLKAVVRAIVMDPEARNDAPKAREFGHLREPVLFITGLLRAFDAQSDGVLNPFSKAMGQDVFLSPSVFSYFPPDHRAPGAPEFLAPEFAILSDTAALARVNFVEAILPSLDLSRLEPLEPTALVDELDRLLLHGTMSDSMRTSILRAMNAAPNAKARARQAVYLVCTSSQYQVQR